MALETFNYLDSLVPTNPVVSDGLVNGDDHIRGIKSTLKATFPNVTGAITATHTAINTAAATIASGVALLDHSHAYNSDTSGFNFVSPTIMDLVVGGLTPVRFTSTTLGAAFSGPVSTTVSFTGPGVIPIGAMVMWLSDSLPSGNGSWCWANGGTLSRTGNGAAVFALWGTTYGAGDGSTTFNVPNMQEVSPVGRSQMGGASSPGFFSTISDGLKAVLNGAFGSQSHTLTPAEIPTITSSAVNTIIVTTDNGGIGDGMVLGSQPTTGGSQPALFPGTPRAQTSRGNNNISVSSNNTGGQAFPVVSPKRVVNFIIRIG